MQISCQLLSWCRDGFGDAHSAHCEDFSGPWGHQGAGPVVLGNMNMAHGPQNWKNLDGGGEKSGNVQNQKLGWGKFPNIR
ncbi:hypothetical protein DF216_10405 [Streptococcus oralis]|uniref:Uncharacterized protein n=1 Tax=Streptococcus oralis TaxID=1303 RepID=A0A4Q2FHI0_STROR|nr:hypothetical protein DF216_10405 [Streptococcus oralis]